MKTAPGGETDKPGSTRSLRKKKNKQKKTLVDEPGGHRGSIGREIAEANIKLSQVVKLLKREL